MFRLIINVFACVTACTSAVAGEVCVSCEKPSMTYRCSVEKSEKLQKFGVEDQAVPMACVQILTRTGGHEKCQIVETTAAPCEGTVKVLGLSDLQKAAAGGPANKNVVPSLMERTETSLKKSWTCVTSLFQTC